MPCPDLVHAPASADEPTSEALLASIAGGDTSGFSDLCDRYRATALRLAYRTTHDLSAAEDVVQESLLSIWQRAAMYDPCRGAARAWILAIVRHRSIDHVRRRRRVELLPSLMGRASMSTVVDDWPLIAAKLDAHVLSSAIAQLRPLQRQAIHLSFRVGLSHREIAHTLDVPLGTIKSRIRDGLRQLRWTVADGVADRTVAVRPEPISLVPQALRSRVPTGGIA